jgi:hypothetical protein
MFEKIFFFTSLFYLFLDPGSEIWDPGWVKSGSGIRDKHPGSATLGITNFLQSVSVQSKIILRRKLLHLR